MPQQEGTTDYKYEDYASDLAVNRLPQTGALVGQGMRITLESGASFELEFVDHNEIVWQSGGGQGRDWCEVVEVAPQTFFVDLTFARNVYRHYRQHRTMKFQQLRKPHTVTRIRGNIHKCKIH